jgi:hypothetical protein
MKHFSPKFLTNQFAKLKTQK